MAFSERLPTRLSPLAERACFSQVGEYIFARDYCMFNVRTPCLLRRAQCGAGWQRGLAGPLHVQRCCARM
jgi:hypothetical protein